MSQPPDEDRGDREQEPEQPGRPSSRPDGDGEGTYPYAPQPWGAPDPQSPPSGPPTQPVPPGETPPTWQPQAPGQGYEPGDHSSSAYGTGGYPSAPGYQQPGYQQPGYQQPGYQQPGYQQPGYQQPGYQQPGYQQYGYAGIPPMRSPEQSSLRTQGIVSLVLNILSVLSCCNVFGIAGAVLAGIALGKIDQDLAHAKNLIKWSWVAFGGGLALLVIGLVAYVGLFAVTGASGGF